jgi:hypothetical protein
MMPVIRIPDSTFERLQTIAKPFVDTPASVIERLLDFYEAGSGGQKQPPNVPRNASGVSIGTAVIDFDPYNPPDLTHTRSVKAEIGGQNASSWNELVYMAHRQAAAELKDVHALKLATLSSIVVGRKNDAGYHYMDDINISIQYVPANTAWKNAFHLVRRFDIEASVEFEWPDKVGAAKPGKRGRLVWTPNKA